MTNAYYAELMFRSQTGDIDVPGVVREHVDGEWIEISPIGQTIVTGISLSAYDICAVVEIAKDLLTLESVAAMEKVLKQVKKDLS